MVIFLGLPESYEWVIVAINKLTYNSYISGIRKIEGKF
jgi:hypothetical protein